jgi:hypothetical protein
MRIVFYPLIRYINKEYSGFFLSEVFMINTIKLPVGIDNFKKLRESHFYYVDKTRLIEQLLFKGVDGLDFTSARRMLFLIKK